MSQNQYDSAKKSFAEIDSRAKKYYSEASKSIASQASSKKAGVDKISYKMPAYNPPSVRRVPVTVTRYTPAYEDPLHYDAGDPSTFRYKTPARYDNGGTYYFDSKTASNIVGEWSGSKYVNARSSGGGYNLTIYDTDKGKPVASSYISSLQKAQSQFNSSVSSAQSRYNSEYRAEEAAAQRRVAEQKAAGYSDIQNQENAARGQAVSMRDSISGEKSKIINELKGFWEERIAVNKELLDTLLTSGILRKVGVSKNAGQN